MGWVITKGPWTASSGQRPAQRFAISSATSRPPRPATSRRTRPTAWSRPAESTSPCTDRRPAAGRAPGAHADRWSGPGARPRSGRRGVQALAGRPVESAGRYGADLARLDSTDAAGDSDGPIGAVLERQGKMRALRAGFVVALIGCGVAVAQTPSNSPPAQTQQAPGHCPGQVCRGDCKLFGTTQSCDTYCKPTGQHWGKCFLVLGCPAPCQGRK